MVHVGKSYVPVEPAHPETMGVAESGFCISS